MKPFLTTMHTTPALSHFKERIWNDWESVFDISVHVSEAIGERLERTKVLPELIQAPSLDIFDFKPADIFRKSTDTEKVDIDVKDFLKEEKEELRRAYENYKGLEKKEKVKSALMSVWSKMIGRSNVLKIVEKMGKRIYEKIIQMILPFDFADDNTPIWALEEESKSIESKIQDHFEEKIKESMRNKIKDRIEGNID